MGWPDGYCAQCADRTAWYIGRGAPAGQDEQAAKRMPYEIEYNLLRRGKEVTLDE